MNHDNLTTAHEQVEDLDNSLRPQHLKQFIGQGKMKENLRVFLDAALKRQKPLDHVLFYGPPGLGKTTLSHIIAKELGVQFTATSGPVLSKAGDLAAILTNLGPGDVLFIDEIHRLQTTVEEILYGAMEDFTLDLIIGEGPAARSVRIDLAPFTLVGATTRLGLLSTPLRDRFGIPLHLQFYTHAELDAVITRGAHIINISIEPTASQSIAIRARGTPRIALRLLKRIADFALVADAHIITSTLVDSALAALDVDKIGLDASDRQYLRFIIDHYQGGPVGIDTIAAGLSEQRDVIEDTIEPYLLQIGYIQRTPRGRMVTHHAYQHLDLPIPKTLQPSLYETEDA